MKRFIVTLLFVVFSLSTIFSEARNALLIANGKYKNFGGLATPVQEAKDLKKTLEKLGFSVTLIENASREKMQDAIDDFGEKIEARGGIGFFHYGGHAVQVNGNNYLIPSDADIPDEKRVKTRSIDVTEIMKNMNADTNIIILDACRNNPLPATSGRSATRGLSLSLERPKNSIIIYSAQPGSIANDGVFTPILTKALLEQKELGVILREVRNEVAKKTNGTQSPGEYNELTTQIYLAGYKKTNSNIDFESVHKTYQQAKAAFSKKDYDTAFKIFSNLAAQGQIDSQFYLGYMYAHALGIKHNYSKAVEWYTKAAEQGNDAAQNNLGYMYYSGHGVKQDYGKAVEWYTKAAEQGNDVAQNDLGNMYCDGYGVKQDYGKAVEWYTKSAEQGYSDAQYNLGYMYSQGFGVEQDYKKAVVLYTMAAEQGHASAKNNLGLLYQNGLGVKQDYTKAFELYTKAITLYNSPRTQFHLGDLYEHGWGVKQDTKKAIEWYTKAAEQGDEEAKKALKRLQQ